MTKRIYSPIHEEEKYTAFSGPKMDLLRKLLLYGRQSTKGQVLNNREAYEQQTIRLLIRKFLAKTTSNLGVSASSVVVSNTNPCTTM